jgi:hypothetical protein
VNRSGKGTKEELVAVLVDWLEAPEDVGSAHKAAKAAAKAAQKRERLEKKRRKKEKSAAVKVGGRGGGGRGVVVEVVLGVCGRGEGGGDVEGGRGGIRVEGEGIMPPLSVAPADFLSSSVPLSTPPFFPFSHTG